MRKIIGLALALALGGCQSTGNWGAISAAVGTVVVADLCAYADNQWAKVGNPTTVQKLAYNQVQAACADPAKTSALLVNTYNTFAGAIGSKKVQ